MSLFNKWVNESKKAIKPLMNKEAKRCGKYVPPAGYEEKLIQQYLTFKIVRVTWILVIVTALIGLLGAIINLVVLVLK